jgi:hypothetical protein
VRNARARAVERRVKAGTRRVEEVPRWKETERVSGADQGPSASAGGDGCRWERASPHRHSAAGSCFYGRVEGAQDKTRRGGEEGLEARPCGLKAGLGRGWMHAAARGFPAHEVAAL